ncbi:unnamed protein product [Paramecium sonneborni]|uniref:Protein kinase domain-containing protein n=1 Tax=Paramecium sonneborni TaxID=65129 RepID=A0A8S1NKR5_9CILI|nr:unnamed protein product [Paramecium sonneborni]
MTLTIGMLGYMASEVVQSKQNFNFADIFSLDCLFYLMNYGQLPFSDQNHQIYLYETENKSINKIHQKKSFIMTILHFKKYSSLSILCQNIITIKELARQIYQVF